MFQGIQVTLYDLFGYLLPGGIILFSLGILFWTLFWPWEPLALWFDLPWAAIVCVLFVAYLAGHLGQAIGNVLEKMPSIRKILEEELPLSQELKALLLEAITSRFGQKAGTLKPKELYRLCDETLIHHGSLGEREIFTYREGFYRGSCVALALLSVSLFLRMVRTPAKLWVADGTVELGTAALILATVTVGLGVWLAFVRYKRFAQHRTRSCFLRFLAFATANSRKVEEKS